MPSALSIREAERGDEDLVLTLLRELADYERLQARFKVTRESIARDFIGPLRAISCDLAFENEAPVGVATWYWTYSSFETGRGLYLEDIYVREAARGHGHGKALMAHLAGRARAHGATHIAWSVLNWNAPSIA